MFLSFLENLFIKLSVGFVVLKSFGAYLELIVRKTGIFTFLFFNFLESEMMIDMVVIFVVLST